MAIAGIITATVFVMFFFTFELWGTITKKDWVIIASYGFRICFLLDLICITVILHLSGILSRYTYNKLGIWFFISNCWVTSKNSIHKCLRSTFVLREMIQCLCKKNTQVVFCFLFRFEQLWVLPYECPGLYLRSKTKEIVGHSFYQNIANFEGFL